MSGRRRRKARQEPEAWWTAPWLAGLFLVALAIHLGLSLTGPVAPWWTWLAGDGFVDPLGHPNPGGKVGAILAWCFNLVFGAVWAWVVPALLLIIGVATWLRRTAFLGGLLLRLGPIWLVTTAWLGQPGWPWGDAESTRLAGVAGFWVGRLVHDLVGPWGAQLFLGLAVLVVTILVSRPVLGPVVSRLAPVGRGLRWLLGSLSRALGRMLASSWTGLRSLRLPRRARRGTPRAEPTARRREDPRQDRAADPQPDVLDPHDPEPDEPTPGQRARSIHWPEEPGASEPAPAVDEEEDGADLGDPPAPAYHGPVELPSLDLLTAMVLETPELSTDELDAAADLLEQTLRSFGVQGEVKDVRPGPVVTTYEYQPAAGVRVNQIVQRANDMALAMRARSLRMEAPIPGKAAVGIEIPNSQAQVVGLREVLQQESGKPRHPLQVTLGKNVEGQPVSIDLAAQPHLLVAGSTGSGKSVCLNAMITNLLLYNDPSILRLLLIDPKMLELNVYNGIPHLLMPVVTDPKEALRAMSWMVAQMDTRYRQLSKHSVRNIEQYNAKVARGEVTRPDGEVVTDPMPYYVTIVDELADLMVQLGQDFEIPITRLAQKARAVGLHLVLATQRPSVDVLTGVIKANIPCRIAFRVIQKNDSRTILDTNGAEQLLGRGDMLYLMPGRAQPIRVHGAFVDVPECERVADHWRQFTDVTEEVSLQAGGEGGLGVHSGEDELFEDAVRIVVLHDSGSTSLLQRRLRIGYTRAGRLMDMMEEAGIVGPFTGSKARDVLVKPADLPDLFGDDDELAPE